MIHHNTYIFIGFAKDLLIYHNLAVYRKNVAPNTFFQRLL